MFFVTAVRDYVDWINASFDAFGQEMSAVQFLQQTLFYLASSAKIGFLYIFTFQWIRDLAYLPILIPQYTEAIVKEKLYFTGNPVLNIFSFAETPTILQNKFIIGFLNSVFASLPFSSAHLIALRRFYLQGWPAAVVTNVGIIAAQVFFLVAILFGWRGLIIPVLQFEPWNYLIGLTIILRIAYDMGQAAGVVQYRQFLPEYKKVFISMAVGGFVLTLCEQSVIFHHINNLTVGLEPSFFEPATSTSANLTTDHGLYVLGFILGSFAFTYLFYWAAIFFRTVVTLVLRITTVRFHAYYHRYSKLFIITLALSSIPFYGVDYYIANPLGFVPNDTSLIPGVFAPNTLNDMTYSDWEGKILEGKDLGEDQALAGFDRGIYSKYRLGKVNTEDLKSFNLFGTDEDYKIPVEYAWLTENMRRPAIRYDFIQRHKKTLERFYGWLEQTGTREMVAKVTGAESTQERQARSEREQAERIENEKAEAIALKKRQELWVPEKFDQFTIIDNANWLRESLSVSPDKTEIDRIFRISRQLFEEPDFEKIENTRPLIDDLLLEAENRRKEAQEITDVTAEQIPKFVARQNFREAVHYDQLERGVINDAYSNDNLIPWVWPAINSAEPEGSQEELVPIHAFFRGPKQRKAQEMFYNSRYYQLLMRTDIDAFMARQPKSHLLTANEEAELYYKRTMLSDYYNSIRQYKKMSDSKEFRSAYGGAKSFAHKVFNHQFKGTYRVARRLFAVDLSPEAHPDFPESRRRVFKYDMPLFDDTESHNPMIHEELTKRREIKKESAGKSRKAREARSQKPFFKATNTSPFYCGWDETKRQFVLTNRLLPRTLAGTRMKTPTEYAGYNKLSAFAAQEFKKQPAKATKSTKKSRKNKRSEKEIVFTWWPIPAAVANDTLKWDSRRGVYSTDRGERHKLDTDHDIEFVLRFDPDYELLPKEEKRTIFDDEEPSPESLEGESWTSSEWPSGFQLGKFEAYPEWWLGEKPPVPFADRGGFVWPGHETLKINIDQFIPETVRTVLTRSKEFYTDYIL